MALNETLAKLERIRTTNGPGKYGEGKVVWYREVLQELKDAVKRGELEMTKFIGYAEEAVNGAKDVVHGIAGRGKKAADAVNPLWNSIVSDGFVKQNNGQWVTLIPFSRREYAELPESSLPTREDVNRGLIDPTTLPMDRFRTIPTPTQPKPPTPPVQPGQPGQPQINPGVIETPVATVLPSAPETVTSPRGGAFGGTSEAGIDESKIIAEAELKKDLLAKTLDHQTSARKKMMDDLTKNLLLQQEQQFAENTPGIMEDLNARGVFRSSGVGNALAKEKSRLAQETSMRLAEQSIGQDAKYADALGSIQEQYMGDRGGAISRRFSLEDFNRQVSAGEKLGGAVAPVPQSSGGKAGGALSGAATGAAAGSAAGPWGAGIGAIAGGALGGKAGKK